MADRLIRLIAPAPPVSASAIGIQPLFRNPAAIPLIDM